jgi:iron complex outermembrane receptor protein
MHNRSICPEQPLSNPLVRLAVRKALSGAVLGGAVVATFGAPTAQAQQQAAATPAPEQTLTEVVVTGSHIVQPALEAVSPVVSVGAPEVQQSGADRIADLLNTLPQITGDMSSSLANGATGTDSVSLRGLGAQRTLVLVNGRRLMPGDPTQNGNAAADINQIPTALIERVDVLTGGASAVYGADAVAGVVNFVMNDHFEGVQLDLGDSFYNYDNHAKDIQATETATGLAYGYPTPTGGVTDGQSADFSAILGSNFDDGKGNATTYLTYRHTDPVVQNSRDYSACALTSSGPKRVCGGSFTAAPTFFTLPNGNNVVPGPGNTLIAAYPSTVLPNRGLFNYAPYNYYQRPDDNYQGGAFAHYDVNDHAKVYLEFQFMDDRTIAQIGPSGAFYGAGTAIANGVPTGAWNINCNNPFINATEFGAFGCTGVQNAANTQVVQLTLGRRNVEGAPRQDDLGHTSFREVLGVKGDINDVWSYDTSIQNGITRFSDEYLNDVSKNNIQNALLAVTQPNGKVVCAANAGGANGAPGCVPWNIFSYLPASTAAAQYLEVPGEEKGDTQQLIWEATVTASDLGKMGLKLPWAETGAGFSVGADYRQETSQLEPDQEFITNDLAGQGSPTLPTVGAFHVWELYSEARLPIMEDQFLAKSLTAEVGYRYSEYNLSFGSTNTWKAGLQWAPIQDFRMRGMYNVAVRAPNIQELYLQQRVQLDGTEDPCAGATPSATAAQCAYSGVTAAEYGHIAPNSANQYNGLVGGNTALRPETAETTTFGLVFTPTVIPDLTATLDYYNINIKNVIGAYGANLIVNNCVDTGSPFYCAKVVRAPDTGAASSGSLWIGTQGYVEDGTYNLGALHERGIDLTTNYKLDLGMFGKLNFDLSSTYTLHFFTTPVPGGGTYDCAGYYGPACGADGGPVPRIKSVFRINYSTPLPGLDLFAKWRLIGPVKAQNLSQNPLLAAPYDPGVSGIGTTIPGYNYLDLGISYQVMKQVAVRFGVNNVLDKIPPIVGEYYEGPPLWNGNTFPSTYDWGGRYLFAHVTLTF